MQRGADREVGDGEPVAGDIFVALELGVEDLGGAVEQFGPFLQLGLVGLARA